MKTTNLSPKVLIGDPKLVLDLDRGSIAARRKQFMREYRKLYKETKRFVDEVLRQNSPQRRKVRRGKRGRENILSLTVNDKK